MVVLVLFLFVALSFQGGSGSGRSVTWHDMKIVKYLRVEVGRACNVTDPQTKSQIHNILAYRQYLGPGDVLVHLANLVESVLSATGTNNSGYLVIKHGWHTNHAVFCCDVA